VLLISVSVPLSPSRLSPRVIQQLTLLILTSNHTQSTAYVLGEMAAEKIIEQYHLENPYKL
jgi:hypothetical protein